MICPLRWRGLTRTLPIPPAPQALYRICGILAGVHARALQGNAASENALRFASHDAQRGIAVAALRVIEVSH